MGQMYQKSFFFVVRGLFGEKGQIGKVYENPIGEIGNRGQKCEKPQNHIFGKKGQTAENPKIVKNQKITWTRWGKKTYEFLFQ
jgi:hypothetical protein